MAGSKFDENSDIARPRSSNGLVSRNSLFFVYSIIFLTDRNKLQEVMKRYRSNNIDEKTRIINTHWRRVGKHIREASTNFGGQNVEKTDKCIGDSQILGEAPGLPPKSIYIYVNIHHRRHNSSGLWC